MSYKEDYFKNDTLIKSLGVIEQYCVDIKARRIYLVGEIELESAQEVVQQLHFLTSEDHFPDDYLKPITIIINSPGGCDDMMYYLYDNIVASSAEIITIGTGMVCSAAVLILACGDRRYATENCWLMTHKGKAVLEGDADEIASQAELNEKLEDRYWKLIERHSTKTAQAWYKKSKADGELWLNVTGMLKWGVIDAVLPLPRRTLEPLSNRKLKVETVSEEEDD